MKTHNIIIKVLAAVLALTAFTSCQEKMKGFGFTKGEAVRFSIGTDVTDTKAAYSGQGTTTIERINWEPGDLIRIYCGAVSEPEEKYADYVVTEVSTTGNEISKAKIGHTSPGELGLRWGTGNHTFYAAFPSPSAKGITSDINVNMVTASLPAKQNIIGNITKTGSSWTATPDLNNMLMTAKASFNPERGITDDVFLPFTPLCTAIQFTIKNDTGSSLELTSVQLVSGNGKENAPVISGPFSVDLDQPGIKKGDEVKPFSDSDFEIEYNQDYPLCTSTAAQSTNQDEDRTLTIEVGTDSAPLTLQVDETFTFTFFLNPIHHFQDLTFKLNKKNGKWMSTRLGYTDGNGIFFPRHKKTVITGLLIPEGAQWIVKYSKEKTVVTKWNTGINGEDIELAQVEPVEFVDLGLPSGTLWAVKNAGATSETEYGDYFAWGELKTKSAHDISTYRWPNFEKYNSIDHLLTLEEVDDVARKTYGPKCSIPTRDQFKELIDSRYTECTWKVNYNSTNINGLLITSKVSGHEGEKIFLPAAGLADNEGVHLVGINGCYWSGTLNQTPLDEEGFRFPACAFDLDFDASNTPYVDKENDDSRRCAGQSIRAVKNL